MRKSAERKVVEYTMYTANNEKRNFQKETTDLFNLKKVFDKTVTNQIKRFG